MHSPTAGVERLFNTLQFGWECVATPCLALARFVTQFACQRPLVALPLYAAVLVVTGVLWLLFGWIASGLWSMLWLMLKLLWYAPLLYVTGGALWIVGRRLLRHSGQQQRALTLWQSAQQVAREWLHALSQRLLGRMMGREPI